MNPIRSCEIEQFYYIQSVERQVAHVNVKWLTQYLCCLWTKMAEIWFPDTFFKDVYTCKILALHHFYFLSYDTFSWWISNFSEIEWFPWLSLYNSESISDRELKFCMCKHLENLWLKKKFQPFWAIKTCITCISIKALSIFVVMVV